MKTQIRSMLAITALAIILAACSQTAGDPTPSVQPSTPPSQAPAETPEPTEAPESPDASPEPIGVMTVQEGAVVDGPGVPLAEAVDGDLSEPILVVGTMVLDADGELFFADAVTDASAPTFGDLRLRVENYPTDGPTWDMASADITGLQEANGVRFYEDAKFYAVIVLDQ
ncbi:MAG: hypothetical protein M3Y40_08360 [Chloroflexota bacterium]|nr:hypothetical protein [Chloroflexota bacterium]